MPKKVSVLVALFAALCPSFDTAFAQTRHPNRDIEQRNDSFIGQTSGRTTRFLESSGSLSICVNVFYQNNDFIGYTEVYAESYVTHVTQNSCDGPRVSVDELTVGYMYEDDNKINGRRCTNAESCSYSERFYGLNTKTIMCANATATDPRVGHTSVIGADDSEQCQQGIACNLMGKLVSVLSQVSITTGYPCP
jgi:hypothetical protein